MLLEQSERLADACQHPEREHIDLVDAEIVDIVLVPFDKTALRHGAVADRHGLGQQLVGEDETADMLAQVPRHIDHLLGQLQNAFQMWIGQVQARLAPDMLLVDIVPMGTPDRAGER